MRATVEKISNRIQWSSSLRTAFSAGVMLVYVLIFVPLYRWEAVGRAAVGLSVMPILAFGGLCGLWPGLIAGLLLIPLNISLCLLAGETNIADFTGSYFWVAHLVFIFSGGTVGWLRNLQNRLRENVLEHRQAREELQESEERFRRIFEDGPLGMAVLNLDNRFVQVNARLCEMVGYPEAELRKRTFMDITHPDDVERDLELSQQLVNVELPRLQHQKRYITRSGDTIWVNLTVTVIRDENGMALYKLAMLEDITDRKEVEQSLRASEERLRGLSESAFEAIFLLEKGLALDQNLAAEQMFGYTLEEVIGKTATDLIAPEDKARVRQNILSCYKQPYEVTAMRKDGSTFPAEIRGRTIDYKGRQVRVTAIRDITERKRAEEELRIQTEHLEALRQVTLDITAELDLTALLEALVKSTLELLKVHGGGIYLYQADRDVLRWSVAIGKNLAPIGSELKRGEGVSGRIMETGQPLIVGDYATWEGRAAIYKDHNWESVMGLPIQWGDEFLGVLDVIDDRPNRFAQADLEFLSLYAAQAAIAIKNARLFDETRSHAAQLEQRVEARTADLKNAHERLKAVSRQRDEFVTSISHELRTPLTSTKLHLQLLKLRPEGHGRLLPQLDREIKRLEYIIEQLLYLSRLDLEQIAPEQTNVNLNELVQQYVEDRQVLAEQKGLELSFLTGVERLCLLADPLLLERVLGILLDNALNYTPPGGKVTIRVDTYRSEGKRWALLVVEDTGPGIPRDEEPRLFERFFRGRVTLDTGTPGSGLGLVIAREIVAQHQGRIEVENRPDVGSRFKVLLPFENESAET